ncbi:MAG: C39 family peptidase [Caldilineaceae bacterium]
MAAHIFQPPLPVQLAVPHREQRHDGDCLATCVEMVLTYLGATFSYAQIARTLKIQPNAGAPFPNIQMLEQMNIIVGYRRNGSMETLYTLLRHGWPVIASVNTGALPYWEFSTGHAVVVVGMDTTHILLNDPGIPAGPIQVLLGDFDLAWVEQDELYAVLAMR